MYFRSDVNLGAGDSLIEGRLHGIPVPRQRITRTPFWAGANQQQLNVLRQQGVQSRGSRQQITESKGATIPARRYQPDRFAQQWIPISARAGTPRSLKTSTRADAGEAYAYNAALARGEVGIQRPMGANDPGPDFMTAVKDRQGRVREVVISDVKTSERGKAPTLRRRIPRTWRAELQQAVAPGRLDTGDPRLDEEIRRAVAEGRVRFRQLEVDMSSSPQGQGKITEARRPSQVTPSLSSRESKDFVVRIGRGVNGGSQLGEPLTPQELSMYNFLIGGGMPRAEALKLVLQLRTVPSAPPGPGPNAQGVTRDPYRPRGRVPKGQGLPPGSLFKRRRGW